LNLWNLGKRFVVSHESGVDGNGVSSNQEIEIAKSLSCRLLFCSEGPM
jgi:hypothetical protein